MAIIIRPHPSIGVESYIDLFNVRVGRVPENVRLTKCYTIREWIVASDVIGSSWSTSVWDAHLIGKPGFLFTPYSRPEWLDVWWNEDVPNFDHLSAQEIMSLLKNKRSADNVNIQDTIGKIAALILDQIGHTSLPGRVGLFGAGMRGTLRIMRCLIREICCHRLGGRFIGSGLGRDYFDYNKQNL